MISIMSLDVSASCTGWVFTKNGRTFNTGTIKTKDTLSRGKRLILFYNELKKILVKYNPEFIVIEDTFVGKNVKTLKLLSEFAGVTKLCCTKVLNVEPYIISNHTVKAFYKVKKKKDLFSFLISILGREDMCFSKDNDIIDAYAQLMCYAQSILNKYTYRKDKDYGYIYYSESF